MGIGVIQLIQFSLIWAKVDISLTPLRSISPGLILRVLLLFCAIQLQAPPMSFEISEGFDSGQVFTADSFETNQNAPIIVSDFDAAAGQQSLYFPPGILTTLKYNPTALYPEGGVIYQALFITPQTIREDQLNLESIGTKISFEKNDNLNILFVRDSGADVGRIWASDNYNNNFFWVPSAHSFELNEDGTSKNWIHLTVRIDYRFGLYDIYADFSPFTYGAPILHSLRFTDPAVTTFQQFQLTNDGTLPIFVDSFYNTVTNPIFPDDDNDGVPNEIDSLPNDPGTRFFDDGDSLHVFDELALGLDPYSADSDADGIKDGAELSVGMDPNRHDLMDDPDQDGYTNLVEYHVGSDPLDQSSIPTADFVVDAAGGGDFTTVSSALDALSEPYQVIVVQPGVYEETLRSTRYPVLLQAASQNPYETVLRATTSAPLLYADKDIYVTGFMLTRRGSSHRGFEFRGTYGGMRNCIIENHYLYGYRGGGAYLEIPSHGEFRFVNCLIQNNKVRDYGGGIFHRGGRLKIDHCTFFGNRDIRSSGNALCLSGPGQTEISNSILWDYDDQEIRRHAPLIVTNSLVRGGYTGSGNLSADPLLRQGYLHPDSPAIDAGSVDSGVISDLFGTVRPTGSAADLGAIEYLATDHDFDGDGLSDDDERNLFLSNFRLADTDGDGLSDYDELYESDRDQDGLSDYAEFFIYFTDINNSDTDGDQITDSEEIEKGLNPLEWDSNFDGISDQDSSLELSLNMDIDQDGISNQSELLNGTNSFVADSDGDGVIDSLDAYPLDPEFWEYAVIDTEDPALIITLKVPVQATLVD